MSPSQPMAQIRPSAPGLTRLRQRKAQRKMYGIIPTGPKSLSGYKTYKLFMHNLADAITAQDSSARSQITEVSTIGVPDHLCPELFQKRGRHGHADRHWRRRSGGRLEVLAPLAFWLVGCLSFPPRAAAGPQRVPGGRRA